ncbi:hypothetical protein RvY_14953 [Ramazzottius varieornatus]|uniref:Uncharacterized protein n=1 Tax=Ramazzottius varieornatus TaxID=947166 RepID=A0A1D1VY17_RAMVA|nr:hypothetical protein RvY_14953 [Ramazzottius varieornatus]
MFTTRSTPGRRARSGRGNPTQHGAIEAKGGKSLDFRREQSHVEMADIRQSLVIISHP